MGTYEKVQADVKTAMLERDDVRRDCLRMLVSDVKNQTVNAGREITEEIVVKCVKKAVKQREDALSQFEQAGRDDLAGRERAELAFLREYLPKAMPEDRLEEGMPTGTMEEYYEALASGA